jgi:hypothetical protein
MAKKRKLETTEPEVQVEVPPESVPESEIQELEVQEFQTEFPSGLQEGPGESPWTEDGGFMPSRINMGPAPKDETRFQRQQRIAKAMAAYYGPYYEALSKKIPPKSR